MKQHIAIITLGVSDLGRTGRFYAQGFGWTPFHTDPETALYEMNGCILSTWLQRELEADMRSPPRDGRSPFTLAHAVGSAGEVAEVMDRLLGAGGQLLRPADAPPHGGLRGYVADPDGHPWEVLWNPGLSIGADGAVSLTASPTS